MTSLLQISYYRYLFFPGEQRGNMQLCFLLGLGMYLLKYILNVLNISAKMPYLVIRFPVNLGKLFKLMNIGEL